MMGRKRLPATSDDEIDAALARLAMAPAVAPIAELPAVLGVDLKIAHAILASLLDAGWVDLWAKSSKGPAVVLSAAAAERLGRELSGDTDTNLRWLPRGTTRERRARRDPDRPLAFTDAGVDADAFADSTPAFDPDDSFTIRVIHEPTLRLWGVSRPLWSRTVEEARPCQVCRRRPFARIDYCLACTRSGRDGELAAAKLKAKTG